MDRNHDVPTPAADTDAALISKGKMEVNWMVVAVSVGCLAFIVLVMVVACVAHACQRRIVHSSWYQWIARGSIDDGLSIDGTSTELPHNHNNSLHNSSVTLNGTARLMMSQRRQHSTTIPMEEVSEDFLNQVRTNRSTSMNNAGTIQPPPDYWTPNPTAPPEEGIDRRESWGGISAPPAYSDIVSRDSTMSTRNGRGVTPPPSYYAAMGTHCSGGGISAGSGFSAGKKNCHKQPLGNRSNSHAAPLAVKPVPINETDSEGAEPMYRDLISKRRRRRRTARARLRRHSTSSSSSLDDDDDDDDYY